MRAVPLLAVASLALAASPPPSSHHAASRSHIQPNDNRRPAGTLKDGVLTLHLVVQDGLFYPDGEPGRGVELQAFAEEGKAPVAPGPLVRVPEGTTLRITVRNALAKPVRIRGFGDRTRATSDSVELAAGETREIVTRAPAPGTYLYSARTTPIEPDRPATSPGMPSAEDSQLVGAFVVDPAGAVPNDRVFVMTNWFGPNDTRNLKDMPFELLMVNGLSWPHTERLSYTVGDSVRWRIVNGADVWHPMHLHGFYYRVDARGDGLHDTTYTAAQQRTVVTEWMRTASTMAMTWSPDRSGNWLFHCHLTGHMSRELRLDTTQAPMASASHASHAANHDDDMGGLVLGIAVKPRAARIASRPASTGPARRLRLYANTKAGGFDSLPSYGFVLQDDAAPARDSVRIPGAPLELVRGEPVEITVFNRTPHPLAVHWHGIELESFYDGVGNFSGAAGRVAPMIAPGDSFVARMTPPRTGTFMYHTHHDDAGQLGSGLYGALVVREPGQRVDPAREHTFLIALGGPGADAPPWIDGSATPTPLTIAAGQPFRLRFANITPMGRADLVLKRDSTVLAWRPVAKDGADLPSVQSAMRRAQLVNFGAGETADFEVTPDAPGAWTLEATVKSLGQPAKKVQVPIVVR